MRKVHWSKGPYRAQMSQAISMVRNRGLSTKQVAETLGSLRGPCAAT